MGPPPDTHAVYELPSGGPLVASLDVQGNQSPDPSSCATQPPLRGFYRQSPLRERAHCHAVQALSRPVSHLSPPSIGEAPLLSPINCARGVEGLATRSLFDPSR